MSAIARKHASSFRGQDVTVTTKDDEVTGVLHSWGPQQLTIVVDGKHRKIHNVSIVAVNTFEAPVVEAPKAKLTPADRPRANAVVKAWAAAQGHEFSATGHVRKASIDAFLAAHPQAVVTADGKIEMPTA